MQRERVSRERTGDPEENEIEIKKLAAMEKKPLSTISTSFGLTSFSFSTSPGKPFLNPGIEDRLFFI